jgi:hypothetical protein
MATRDPSLISPAMITVHFRGICRSKHSVPFGSVDDNGNGLYSITSGDKFEYASINF